MAATHELASNTVGSASLEREPDPATPTGLISAESRTRRAAVAPAFDRRRAVARAMLRAIRAWLPAESPVELGLAGDPVAVMTSRSGAEGSWARIVFADPDALGRTLWPLSPDAFGEAYLRGDLEIVGDVAAAVRAGQGLRAAGSPSDLRRLLRWALELRRGAGRSTPLTRMARLRGRRHSRARDLAAVRFHYDVGNDFYGLWLDARLTYSCAYFEHAGRPGADIDRAQEAKLDLICRKLRLQPGMRLLDVGCGWGSLVIYAAERFGVSAVGITLSEKQAAYARHEVERRGLGGQVRVEVRDYRDLAGEGAFDAVASVGMFEHVGRERLDEYFAAAFEAVRPGGLFLNHGIAAARASRSRSPFRPIRRGSFVDRFVFPDGDLVGVADALDRARRAGFELLDVQSLRHHYALTLRAWVERLEANAGRARELAGEEVFRTWRLYMAGARTGFEDGSLDVAQILLARPTPAGPAELPLRPWW